jgi:hypothetical protein
MTIAYNNSILSPILNQHLQQPTVGFDIYSRTEPTVNTIAPQVSQVYFTFFTAYFPVTVSSVTVSSGSIAGVSLTIAKVGLYTFDETTATLVARIANDTSLFAAVNTSYLRSFSTVGGYPSSYSLVAGVRYGIGVSVVGTTLPNFCGKTIAVGISTQTPRTNAVFSGSDLPTTANSFTTAQGHIFARLS